MVGTQTFAMLKPDAVSSGKAGAILAHIEQSGFAFRAIRMVRLTRAEAEAFYAVHAARPFYGELVEFMSSGPVVALALEAPNFQLHRLVLCLQLHLQHPVGLLHLLNLKNR